MFEVSLSDIWTIRDDQEGHCCNKLRLRKVANPLSSSDEVDKVEQIQFLVRLEGQEMFDHFLDASKINFFDLRR